MTSKAKKLVLIVDDEREYLEWMEDFLVAQGLVVHYANNIKECLDLIAANKYQLFLLDMNIPDEGAIEPKEIQRVPVILKYPGIFLAHFLRNKGYKPHTVIGYTVHDDDVIGAELGKLHCRYVLKGRPQAIKTVIKASLKPTPQT
jgi:CheY-like chemotaxis protein